MKRLVIVQILCLSVTAISSAGVTGISIPPDSTSPAPFLIQAAPDDDPTGSSSGPSDIPTSFFNSTALLVFLLAISVVSTLFAYNRCCALFQSKRRYRDLVDDALAIILKWDADGKITFWNEFAVQVFGYRREEALGRDVLETLFTTEEQSAKYFNDLKRLVAGKPNAPTSLRTETITQSGERRWISWTLRPILDRSETPVEIHAIGIDVTTQYRTEKALRTREKNFREFCEAASVGIVRATPKGDLLYTNRAFAKMAGFSSPKEIMPHLRLDALVETEMYAALRATVERDRTVIAYPLELKQGREKRLPVLFSGVLRDGVIEGTVVDVTERQMLEKQLQHLQTMEAVGTLAGGIAHDFNNILTAVLGYLTLAEMRLGPESPAASDLANAKAGGDRAADLVRQLLALGHKTRPTLKPVRANPMVEEAVSLLRHTMDARVQLITQPTVDDPTVAADAVQINQVLVSLCMNARDSLVESIEKYGHTAPPAITIATRVVDADSLADRPVAAAKRTAPDAPDGYVSIEVRDNGCGMDEETKQRIFEPFFTTREVGEGSGLGLSTVFGIVKRHAGWVDVESAPGEGATFTVFLPVTTQEAPAREFERDAPSPSARRDLPLGKGETILIVDDDEAVLSLGQMLLERSGYKVIVGRDGREGLDIYRDRQGEIDLFILDQSMPHLTGSELLDRILEDDPSARAILCSGYDVSAGMDRAELGRFAAFLSKPYEADNFIQTIRTTLAT